MTYSMLHWQGFMWPQGPYIKQILFRRHIKLSTYSKDKNYSYIQVSWHFVFKEKKLYGLDWENLYYILYWHYHYTRVTNDISAVCHVCQLSSQVKTYELCSYLYGLFFYILYTQSNDTIFLKLVTFPNVMTLVDPLYLPKIHVPIFS